MRSLLLAVALVTMLALVACANDTSEPILPAPDEKTPADTPPAPDPEPELLRWNCEDPRPARCGTEDTPVCGSTGATFRNACYACRDAAVLWYTEGACA